MIGQTIFHYRVVEKISEGRMGQVDLAQNTKLIAAESASLVPSLRLTCMSLGVGWSLTQE